MLKPSEMNREAFCSAFGGVFEHSPWVAEEAYDAGLGPEADTAEGLHAALCAAMRKGSPERLLALIRAHPDLAGRATAAEDLTPASAAEQESAGLDRLDEAETARLADLNETYKSTFGFPFIMAVRGRSKDEILTAFEKRLDNDPEVELAAAVREIEAIAKLRIDDLMA
ncbi:MAG: 2-oxo-4-hydroxy-4-carboxy-5-ureidoimidazoline decarboxylase [Geminicoccaceae bacterium]|nr:2-oxo-4-hydroxy-4-carboxy-5-ureidoimidazoline decarboxylase [Geminicoccaceae bacterium]